MLAAILLFSGMTLFLFFFGKKELSWKTQLILQAGWVIKCFAAYVLFYVYSEVYGNGKLTEDPGAYVNEAKILNSIYQTDKAEYFKIIFNKSGSEEAIVNHFKEVKNSRIGSNSEFINDTRNQIKFISLVSLVIGTNEMALFAFYSLLSFIGLLVLWKALCKKTSLKPYVVFLLLLLPLNLMFWTSSPLKECTFIFGLQLLLASAINSPRSAKWIFIGGIGFSTVLFFKPHLALILVISYFIVYVYRKMFVAKKWSYGLTLLLFLSIGFYFKLHQKSLFTISDKQFDFVNIARGGVHMEGDTCFYFVENKNREKIKIENSLVKVLFPVEAIAIQRGKIRHEKKFVIQPDTEKLRLEYEQIGGKSYFETQAINRSWSNLVKGIPEAIINSTFRPFPWTSFFSIKNIILTVENLAFLFLLIKILSKSKNQSTSIRFISSILLVSSVIYLLIIGFTTPISGAIIRYRIPIHLFILTTFILTFKRYEPEK